MMYIVFIYGHLSVEYNIIIIIDTNINIKTY